MKNIIVLVFLILLLGCSAKPYVVHHAEEFTGAGANQVYITNHGWHTGLVIPAAAMQLKIPALKQRFGDIPYIEFGWGDKGFYQANEITSGLTLKAIFWPTESVMHVVAVPGKVSEYFVSSQIEKICMSDSEFDSLMVFISDSFYKDDTGKVSELKNGLYGDSQFYTGVGDYYAMNTCNKWTAKGLKSAGMNISPMFKLTAKSVMAYVQEYNQVRTDKLNSDQSCF
jgi:uncharacterized protein (TIGR02117 family)